MKRKVGPDALILTALLLLFAVLAYRIAEQGETGAEETGTPRRTTYSRQKGGWKAFYLLLQREKFDVRRVTKAPEEWPDDATVMVSASEYFGGISTGTNFWDDAEVRDALTWVDKGGTLILLVDDENGLTRSLKLTAQNYFAKDADVPPVQPAAFLSGIRAIHVPSEGRWRDMPRGTIPVVGDTHPAVVVLPHGEGRIVAVTDPAIADNTHLGTADNARFLTQLIAASAGSGEDRGAVAFDEFHQGYTDSGDGRSLWSAIGRPGQLAAYQLLAVILLAAYSAARRFGRPRPVPEPPRVTSEYVASLADLYHRAHAGETALESVYLSFWRDLCRTVGMPLDTDAAEVAPRAAAALGSKTDPKTLPDRLQRLLETCEARIADPGKKGIGDTELLRLAREIEAMRKEMDLGGTDERT